eukprot:m.52750 g.52750  ORF g.52750 m.52750 type:complete len:1850 (-) comp7633_c0_seq1:1457-7006(-)
MMMGNLVRGSRCSIHVGRLLVVVALFVGCMIGVGAQQQLETTFFCADGNTDIALVVNETQTRVVSHEMFPNSVYPPNTTCVVEVSSHAQFGIVEVEFESFDVVRGGDALILQWGSHLQYHMEIYPTNTPSLLSTPGNPLRFTFSTDGTNEATGFSFLVRTRNDVGYSGTDISLCEDGILDARNETMLEPFMKSDGTVHIISHYSYGYTDYFNNMDCELVILIPSDRLGSLSVLDILVEDGYDTITVTSGSSTSSIDTNSKLAVGSFGENITVSFSTDSTSTRRGFVLQFSFIDVQANVESYSPMFSLAYTNSGVVQPEARVVPYPIIVITSNVPIGTDIGTLMFKSSENFNVHVSISKGYDFLSYNKTSSSVSFMTKGEASVGNAIITVDLIDDSKAFCVTLDGQGNYILRDESCKFTKTFSVFVFKAPRCALRYYYTLSHSTTYRFSIPSDIELPAVHFLNVIPSIAEGTVLLPGIYPLTITVSPLNAGSIGCHTELYIFSGVEWTLDSVGLTTTTPTSIIATVFDAHQPFDVANLLLNTDGGDLSFNIFSSEGMPFFINAIPNEVSSAPVETRLYAMFQLCTLDANVTDTSTIPFPRMGYVQMTLVMDDGSELLLLSESNTASLSMSEDGKLCIALDFESAPLPSSFFHFDLLVFDAFLIRSTISHPLVFPTLFMVEEYVVLAMATAADGSEITTMDSQPVLLSSADIIPPVIENCPMDPIIVYTSPSEEFVEVDFAVLNATDNFQIVSTSGPSAGSVMLTLSQSPFDVKFQVSDGVNVATCEYQIDVEVPSHIPFALYTPVVVKETVTKDNTLGQSLRHYSIFGNTQSNPDPWLDTYSVSVLLKPSSTLHVRDFDNVLKASWDVQLLLKPTGGILTTQISPNAMKVKIRIVDANSSIATFHPRDVIIKSQQGISADAPGFISVVVDCPIDKTLSFEASLIIVDIVYTFPLHLEPFYNSTIPLGLEVGQGSDVSIHVIEGANDEKGRTQLRAYVAEYDDVPPVATSCPTNITADAPSDSHHVEVHWETPTFADNKNVFVVVHGAESGAMFNISDPYGIGHVVTSTAFDDFGNKAVCEFTIVVCDVTPPIVACSDQALVVELGANEGLHTPITPDRWPANVADNGAPVFRPVRVMPNNVINATLGTYNADVVYSDWYGNEGQCESTIQVVDLIEPTIKCPSDIEQHILEGEVGNVTIVIFATDNARVAHVYIVMEDENVQVVLGIGDGLSEYGSNIEFSIGTTQVVATVVDIGGNAMTCSFDVAVSLQAVVSGSSQKALAPTGAAIGVGVIAIVVLVMFVFVPRKRGTKVDNWDDAYGSLEKFKISIAKDKISKPREINRSHLKTVGTIGKGSFGLVEKAMLKEPTCPEKLVAAKSLLKEKVSPELREEFLAEALMIAQLDHRNVMRLIGVVSISEPIYLVLEFAERGSLKSYLVQKGKSINLRTMLSFIHGACAGLQHIHLKGCIHRDIAARNILLSSDLIPKIGDFGLARELSGDKEYYRSHGNGIIPVRWTSLEALKDCKFTEASDVWAMGIVMYEIFTHGDRPYKGLNQDEVVNMVERGERLSCPSTCPKDVYEHMSSCWNEVPGSRPTFSQLTIIFYQLKGAYSNSDAPSEVARKHSANTVMTALDYTSPDSEDGQSFTHHQRKKGGSRSPPYHGNGTSDAKLDTFTGSSSSSFTHGKNLQSPITAFERKQRYGKLSFEEMQNNSSGENTELDHVGSMTSSSTPTQNPSSFYSNEKKLMRRMREQTQQTTTSSSSRTGSTMTSSKSDEEVDGMENIRLIGQVWRTNESEQSIEVDIDDVLSTTNNSEYIEVGPNCANDSSKEFSGEEDNNSYCNSASGDFFLI